MGTRLHVIVTAFNNPYCEASSREATFDASSIIWSQNRLLFLLVCWVAATSDTSSVRGHGDPAFPHNPPNKPLQHVILSLSFIIYINDIVLSNDHFKFITYADDTTRTSWPTLCLTMLNVKCEVNK